MPYPAAPLPPTPPPTANPANIRTAQPGIVAQPQAAYDPFKPVGGPMPPGPPPGPAGGPTPVGGTAGNFTGINPAEKNFYGGQQIAGARPEAADYGSVQTYADAAMANANRYLDPELQSQRLRFNQDLVNKGIDPMSDMGKQMADNMARQQADAKSGAAFQSLGFGQGIQNQMAQQGLGQQQLAGDMQKALWEAELGASGQKADFALGKAGIAGNMATARMQDATNRIGQKNDYNLGLGQIGNQRYGMDQDYSLGLGQQDYLNQGQNFQQMMDLEGTQYRDKVYNDSQQNYRDLIAQGFLTPAPGASQVGVEGAYGAGLANQGTSMFGNIVAGANAVGGIMAA